MLVATGRTPFEELAALDPDVVLPDLSDVEAVLRILLDGAGGSASLS
jgi:hypothetical protein